MPHSTEESDAPLICHRCGAIVHPGRGDHYLVRIEAVADPSPPVLEDDDLAGDVEELIDDMSRSSAQELMDQVHRRVTLHLCRTCFVDWIERPAG